MSIISELTNKYKPVQLITVYKDDNRNYYLESTEIEKGKQGASTPLKEDVLSEIVMYFSDLKKEADNIKGGIPETVLYCEWAVETKVLIWYNKPMVRHMYFTDDLKIPSGSANQPTIVYVVINNHLDVFICKASKVVNSTALFVAPYHNTGIDGSVCLGSSSVKKPARPTYTNIMEYWEKKFWNSEFSHLAGKNQLIKGNINLFWKDMIKSKKDFDHSVLIASKYKTFENLLKSKIRNA